MAMIPTSSDSYRFSHDVEGVSEQAWLWVASILAVIYAFLVLVLRGAVKWSCLGSCDWILLAAYGFSYVVVICIWVALSAGLGKAAGQVDEVTYVSISRMIFVCQWLLYIVLGITKISVLFFVRRMVPRDMRKKWLAINISIWLVSIITVLGPAVMTGICSPDKFLDANPHAACKVVGLGERTIAMQTIDAMEEILIAILPIWICFSVQMTSKHKMLVLFGFGLRLTILPFTFYYAYSVRQFLHSGRSNIGLVKPLILQQVLIGYSLCLSTTPVLRSFVQRFRTGGIRTIAGQEPRKRVHPHSLVTTVKSRLLPSKTSHSGAEGTSGRSTLLGILRSSSVAEVPPSRSRSTDSALAGMEWEEQMGREKGWERERAAQLMHMPKRMSAQELTFITVIDMV